MAYAEITVPPVRWRPFVAVPEGLLGGNRSDHFKRGRSPGGKLKCEIDGDHPRALYLVRRLRRTVLRLPFFR